jgi:hypothetical protein
MASVRGVKAVAALRTVPCIMEMPQGGQTGYLAASLRARDIASDQSIWRFDEFVQAGRPFRPADSGMPVALQSKHLRNALPVKLGEPLRVLVPRATLNGPTVVWDYAHPIPVELELIGQFAVPTEIEVVRTDPTPEGAPGETRLVQRYWETDQILVPSGTLDAIYRSAGGGGSAPAYQVGIAVNSMFEVKTVAESLSRGFGGLTVMTVPEEVEYSRWESGQPSVPQDLNRVFAMLGYLVAGFLVMANMHVLTSQRRKELGVLKAIGASSGEIFSLILFEAVGFSLLGAVSGFVTVRGFISLVYMYTDVGLFKAGLLTLESVARVLGTTVGVSVLFGFGPAFSAARSTTLEVLRSE